MTHLPILCEMINDQVLGAVPEAWHYDALAYIPGSLQVKSDGNLRTVFSRMTLRLSGSMQSGCLQMTP